MDSHSYEPEMCRFLELAPEVLDEVFEDTGVFLKFQKGVFVLFFGRNRSGLSFPVNFADGLHTGFGVLLVVDKQ